MRKTMISALSVILCLCLVLALGGCGGSEREIRRLMSDYERACNALDFDGVLDCISPKIADTVRLAAGVIGMITSTDTDELFARLAEVLAGEEMGGTGFFSTVQIDIRKITCHEDSAEVSAVLTYCLDDRELVREATFHCVFYAEKWYIAGYTMD